MKWAKILPEDSCRSEAGGLVSPAPPQGLLLSQHPYAIHKVPTGSLLLPPGLVLQRGWPQSRAHRQQICSGWVSLPCCMALGGLCRVELESKGEWVLVEPAHCPIMSGSSSWHFHLPHWFIHGASENQKKSEQPPSLRPSHLSVYHDEIKEEYLCFGEGINFYHVCLPLLDCVTENHCIHHNL